MKRDIAFKLLPCLLASLLLFACDGQRKDISPSAEFAPYINAYTGGVISRQATIRIELAQQKHFDLVAVLGQHFVEHGFRHRRLKMKSVAAILHLPGISPITIHIVLLHPACELREQSGGSLPCCDICRTQAVHRKPSDMCCPFKNHSTLPLTGGGYRRRPFLWLCFKKEGVHDVDAWVCIA